MVKKIFIILLLSVVSFLGYYFCPRYLLSSTFSYLSYPFLVIQKKALDPIYSISDYCYRYKKLCNDLKSVKKETEDLKADLIKYKSFFKFYTETHDLRIFAKRYNQKNFILASVLLKNLDKDTHFFLVDAGQSRNIQPDMVVIYKNAIIGRIVEVYPAYSKVLLITDKSCKISACCKDSNIQAIHEGCNNINFTRLFFVDHLQKPRLNDLVLSSGEGTIFPKGFALGNITSIKSKGLYYSIKIKPIFDLNAIKYCYINVNSI